MAGRRLTRRQLGRIRDAQERRRERVTQQTSREVDRIPEGELSSERFGRVIANYGASLVIEDEHRHLQRCVPRQNLGTLACGDEVTWQACATGDGVVVALNQRRSLLTRPDYGGRPKPVAANVELVVVVVAPRPELDEFLIDRYLVAVSNLGIDALIVVNKTDLLRTDELAALQHRLSTYALIGYSILLTSAHAALGLVTLCEHLANRTSILVGQSGVGKSSLVRALLPDRAIRVQALSAATGLGTHATTTAALYDIPTGGNLIDSPGVRSFDLGEIERGALERGFVEFRPFLGHCRFSDCAHTVEPGCALQEALKDGKIEPRRLQSYFQLRKIE